MIIVRQSYEGWTARSIGSTITIRAVTQHAALNKIALFTQERRYLVIRTR